MSSSHEQTCGAVTGKGTTCTRPAGRHGRCSLHGARSPGAGYGPVRLYKDKRTGYWWARFQYRGQREKLKIVGAGGVPVTRKAVAEKHAREIAELLETGQYSKLKNRTEARHKSFADLVEEFIEKGCPQTRHRGGYWAESTRRQSKSTLNLLVRELGELAIGDVDAEAIEAYLARLRDEGKSTGTRNRHLAIFKVLLAKAHEWGYTRVNAAREVGTERIGRKKPRPYREEELARLLPVLEDRHRAITTVYLETGLRRSELMKLLWADVDLLERTLTVRETKNEDDRVIPLSTRAYEVLAQRRKEWESERRRTEVVEPRVYAALSDIRQVLDRALARLHLDPDRRAWLRPIHSLRDTFITRLAKQGVPLDRRMKLAGHRDPTMNLAYGEVEPESLRDAIALTFDREVV